MKNRFEIAASAGALLALDPDTVPRYLILRDLLHRPPSDREMQITHQNLPACRAVAELDREQLPDGGWGRFHTADSKTRIGTTEQAVQRAITLGLEQKDEIVARAQAYLVALLAKQIRFPDRPERNDRWATGEEMFTASTLAWIDPCHPALEPVYAKWCRIAERTFTTGDYDAGAEWRAHCQMTGATTMRGSYLVLCNRYAVYLLSRVQDRLSDRTESGLVNWLWNLPRGMGYLDVPVSLPVTKVNPRALSRWFFSHQVLARFRSWPRKAKGIMNDLGSLRGREGLWNFGVIPGGGNLRLSDSWRKPSSRIIDHSVAVLQLAAQFEAGCG